MRDRRSKRRGRLPSARATARSRNSWGGACVYSAVKPSRQARPEVRADLEGIGRRIRELRGAERQEDLAASLGISQSQLSRIEYKKGASIPTGQTEFQFKAGDLNFHSTEYEWLVVAGAMAQFKGSGTINGTGDYGFLLTAQDSAINGGPVTDTFRIKIWDKTSETTAYDNGTNQAVGGGSIVIHSK